MKCPNCGEEIKEGYLYCEKCGEDIHIVPDYEPDLEFDIYQSIEGILHEVEKEKMLENERELAHKQKKQKRIKLCVLACVFVLLLGALWGVSRFVKHSRYHSFDYQLKQAYACLNEGEITDAVSFYERALELNPKNALLRLELAESYGVLGMESAYMEQLSIVSKASYSSDADVENAYQKMIAFYLSKEDYEAINQLLRDCTYDVVVNANQKYLANPPEFSYQAGTYEEIIPLKLSSNSSGVIYYTLDGSVPTTESDMYTAPIFLETGEHIISAVFINDYGIVSDVVTKEFCIEVIRPDAPEVLTYSGEYSAPVSITVDVLEGCRVFYTTDGTMPTDQSMEYLGPIPMPLGKSWYKFITYNEEGVSGEITSREYKLQLDTAVSVDDARQAVIDIMLSNGKIYNSFGESYNVEGKYLYIFQYPLAVPDKGDYYVIAEVYEDSTGLQSKTGSNYAVNIYNKTVYKFTKDNGNYLLEGF